MLFLGGDTPRRGAVLSTLGPVLWDRHADLRLFRFTEPVEAETGEDGKQRWTRRSDAILEAAVALLEHERVLVHPGYFFDFPHEAFIVVSLLPEPDVFADAFERALRFMN